MQRKFVMLVVALSLTVLYAASASAMGRPFQIGFGGGVSVPVSDYKSAFDNGFHGKAMFRWKAPALPISLGTSLGFPVGPIKPYVTAGLGAYHINSSATGLPDASTTKFGIDGGLGVEFKLGGISAFAEGKYENIYTDQGINQNLKTQIVPVTFGVFF
jgi:opacity protein-like surface antigen